MKIVQAPRASTILYHLLASQKNGKPWLLPANICPIVPITFIKAGVPFEFIDISAKTLHLDLDQAEGRIKKRETGGLLYAHTYGEPSTPDDFFRHVKTIRPDLLIVDDRCLSEPEFDRRGSADVVLFSTGYAKVVDLRSGGYALIQSDVRYEPVTLPFDARAYPELEQAYKKAVRDRARFSYQDSDWLETTMTLESWEQYRGRIKDGLKAARPQRENLNSVYSSQIPEAMQLPKTYQGWRFNIITGRREELLAAIFEANLFASSHYASLAGVMSDGRAPHAEQLARSVINLFNDIHFSEEMAHRLCDLILENRGGWL